MLNFIVLFQTEDFLLSCFIYSSLVQGLLRTSNKAQLSQKMTIKNSIADWDRLDRSLVSAKPFAVCGPRRKSKTIKIFTKHYINAVNLCQNMLGEKLSLFCNKYFQSLVTTNIGNLQKVNRRHVVPLFFHCTFTML